MRCLEIGAELVESNVKSRGNTENILCREMLSEHTTTVWKDPVESVVPFCAGSQSRSARVIHIKLLDPDVISCYKHSPLYTML